MRIKRKLNFPAISIPYLIIVRFAFQFVKFRPIEEYNKYTFSSTLLTTAFKENSSKSMWSNGFLRIKQFRIVQETLIFMIIRHKARALSLDYFRFHTLLLIFTQPSNMSAIYTSSVRRLELRKQFDIFIIWTLIEATEDALCLFFFVRVGHLEKGQVHFRTAPSYLID